MENPKSPKKFLKKLFIDPCPIMEYFVNEEDYDIIQAILGIDGIQELLDTHTVNYEYATSIAARMRVPYTPAYPEVSTEETKDFLQRPLSPEVEKFLLDRQFPLDLVSKYEISSWQWEQHSYTSWANYFPFNQEAMMVSSAILAKLDFPIHLWKEPQLTCPSYDRNGKLNNLVFRYVDETISSLMCKWLFSHGRQATFGLHKIDPSKPVYLVEGLFDHVACDLIGDFQTVGLGSAFISEAHWKMLEGLDTRFLLDSDEVGYKYSQRLKEEGHKVYFLSDEYKDPWEFYRNGAALKFQ